MSKQELQQMNFKEFAPGYYINRSGLVYSYKSQKLLGYNTNNAGYLRTEICINGKRKHIFVHLKVVEMFGDGKGQHLAPGTTSLLDLGLSVDHLDNDRTNPKIENLEIVSHKENCRRREERAKELSLEY